MVDGLEDVAGAAVEVLGTLADGATDSRSRWKRWGCWTLMLVSTAVGLAFWWFS